jgi:hypothetical protein
MDLETEYKECDECRMKPGSPILCSDCLERRAEHSKTGKCRPPKLCLVDPVGFEPTTTELEVQIKVVLSRRSL